MSDKTQAAFPTYHAEAADGKVRWCNDGGMTLRDYFAAAAVQGLMDSMAEPKRVAHLAYRVADAMLKEREGSGDE